MNFKYPFMFVYQPKGDAFTHIKYFSNINEAIELFYTTKKFFEAFNKPVRLDLYDNRPKAIKAATGDYRMHFDNTQEDQQ